MCPRGHVLGVYLMLNTTSMPARCICCVWPLSHPFPSHQTHLPAPTPALQHLKHAPQAHFSCSKQGLTPLSIPHSPPFLNISLCRKCTISGALSVYYLQFLSLALHFLFS